jgi:hypothetical protein
MQKRRSYHEHETGRASSGGGNGLYLLAGRSISEVEGLLQYRVEGLQYCGMTTGLYVEYADGAWRIR